MNWLDIVIIVAMVMAVFGGLKNGIIKGVVTLVGLILGIVLAGRYSETLGAVLPQSWGGAAEIVGFVIILILVMLVAAVVAFLLRNLLKAMLLGWVDRLGGAAFGLILAAFFWGAILAIWIQYLGPSDIVAASLMAGFLLDAFPFVLGLLPAEFDVVKGFFA